jgi:hypothetical protein
VNSLEDAYIKIAEDEINAHQKKLKKENQQSAYIHRTVDLDIFDNMDRSRRNTAFSQVDTILENYKRVEGNPTWCSQFWAIFLRRLI